MQICGPIFFFLFVCSLGSAQNASRVQIDSQINDSVILNVSILNQQLVYDALDWIDRGDVTVRPCPDQTYSDDNSGICRPCQTCVLGYFVAAMCEPWANTYCAPCAVCSVYDVIKCECNKNTAACPLGNTVCIQTVPIVIMAGLPMFVSTVLSDAQYEQASVRLGKYMVNWIMFTFGEPQVRYVSLIQVASQLYIANFVISNVQNQTTIKSFREGDPPLFNQGFQYTFSPDRDLGLRRLLQDSSPSLVLLQNETALQTWFEIQAKTWYQQYQQVIQDTLLNLTHHKRFLLQTDTAYSAYPVTPIYDYSVNGTCPRFYYVEPPNLCYPGPVPPGFYKAVPLDGKEINYTACPQNTYKNTTGDFPCLPCPAGSISPMESVSIFQCVFCRPGFTPDLTGLGQCVPCAQDSFKNTSGNALCTLCPDQGIAPLQSTSLANCSYCPRGEYMDFALRVCTPCANNSYKDAAGNAPCTICPMAGTSPPRSISLSNCSVCGKGLTYSTTQMSCVPCDYDTYKDVIGNFPCTACTPGYYATFPAATSPSDCFTCDPGTYLHPDTRVCTPCPADTYKPTRFGQCIPCTDGYASPPGSILLSNCVICPTGYTLNLSNYQCTICPADTYKSTASVVPCTPCPFAGSSLPGSTSRLSCSSCYPGYYYSTELTYCRPCPENTYKDTNSDAPCTPCPHHGTSPEASMSHSDCSVCPFGEFYDPLIMNCATCPLNTYKDTRADIPCIICPNQSFAGPASISRSNCTGCPAGTFVPDTVNRTLSDCSPCAPGSFRPDSSWGSCSPCPFRGQNLFTSGNTVCQFLCPSGQGIRSADTSSPMYSHWMRGFYNQQPWYDNWNREMRLLSNAPMMAQNYIVLNNSYVLVTKNFSERVVSAGSANRLATPFENGLQCASCPVGTFSVTEAGMTFCKDCPLNYFLNANRTQCLPCPPGSMGNLYLGGSEECILCNTNEYAPSPSTGCIPCPPGFFSNSGSSVCTKSPVLSTPALIRTTTTILTTTTMVQITSSAALPVSPFQLRVTFTYQHGTLSDPLKRAAMIQAIAAALGVSRSQILYLAVAPTQRRLLQDTIIQEEILVIIDYPSLSDLHVGISRFTVDNVNPTLNQFGLTPMVQVHDMKINEIPIQNTVIQQLQHSTTSIDIASNTAVWVVIIVLCVLLFLAIGVICSYQCRDNSKASRIVPVKLKRGTHHTEPNFYYYYDD